MSNPDPFRRPSFDSERESYDDLAPSSGKQKSFFDSEPLDSYVSDTPPNSEYQEVRYIQSYLTARQRLILALGGLAWLSIVLCITGPLAILLGLITVLMARANIEQMKAGKVNPITYPLIKHEYDLSKVAIGVGCAATLVWLVALVAYQLR